MQVFKGLDGADLTLTFSIIAFIIRIAVVTIRIHHHNMKLQDKLGVEVYNSIVETE